jgi:hypothetical protein
MWQRRCWRRNGAQWRSGGSKDCVKESGSLIGGRRWANKIGSSSVWGRSGSRDETIQGSGCWRSGGDEFGEQLVNFRSSSVDGLHQGLSSIALILIWVNYRRSFHRRGCARVLHVGQSGMLCRWRWPIQIIRIWLALAYAGHQSGKVDSARRGNADEGVHSPLHRIR